MLNQTRAPEVSQLLKALNSSDLALSDFSLHSICVILGRTQRLTLLDQFVTDLFVQAQTALVSLSGAEVQEVTTAMRTHQLDFDDAYQYVVAKRDQLDLVSFDTDFDPTDLPRQTPAQVLATVAPPQLPPDQR